VSELRNLLQAIDRLAASARRAAIATVIDVRGSTYRRPGAKLLVPDDGAPIGTISGGCLEGDVAEVARAVIEDGTSRVRTWDLTADDDEWGLGLGCNGAIEVLIEPIDASSPLTDAIRSAVIHRRPTSLVTVVDSEFPAPVGGSRVVVRLDGTPRQTSGDLSIDAQAAAAARRQLGEGGAGIQHLAGGTRAFVDVFEPPTTLLICGAGPDAEALVDAASGIGWPVVVADERANALAGDGFRAAERGVSPDRPERVASAAGVDRWTFAVVMSHHFQRDKAYARSLLRSSAPYIGMLGPAARTRRIVAELAAEGVTISDEELRRLHGPAGLDVGAEGPHEIAAAICAEVIAVRSRRNGGFLRERAAPIHGRPSDAADRAASSRIG
jgi:xanthine/CO dehydrogenase XdhC/CoxF family maturation factor